MAKKSARMKIGLVCTVDNTLNYVTEYNRLNTKEFADQQKFCKTCQKKTTHKMKKKLF